jgi:hypothetical protein
MFITLGHITAQFPQIGNDIDCGAANDLILKNVSLNASGKIIAIGSPYVDSNGIESGQVRIFEWNGNSWLQKGSFLNGNAGNLFGSSVNLNNAGNILAVCAKNNNDTSFVRIFEWNGNSWQQKGADIKSGSSDDISYMVKLNSNGNIFAVGYPITYGTSNGYVKIFEWNGNSWQQKGLDIVGVQFDDSWGSALNLNANGNIIAIGAPLNDGIGTDAGHVRVFEWNGSIWLQKGSDINGVQQAINLGKQ